MAKQLILRSQANEILSLVQAAGLDPTLFAWREAKSRYTANLVVSVLGYGQSDYYFRFDFSNNMPTCDFSPGEDKLVDTGYTGAVWSGQVRCAKDWLSWLRREVQAPDLWAAIAGSTALIGASERPVPEGPFSTEERKRVAVSINELKEYIQKSYEVPLGRWTIVSGQLDYLIEATTRMGKKDWVLLAAGTLVNVVLTASLSPDAAKDVLRFAGHVLGWIFTHQILLP